MKAYPLIYSRILNDDYPDGFLARPEDLDVPAALRYVIPAMENILHTGGVRHAIFPAGEYLVYGGIACVAGKLVERILRSGTIDFPYEEYLTDQAGRPMIFFVGFAMRKGELVPNQLPDIDLCGTYKIYLSYLTRQWRNKTAATVFPEGLELKTRPYNRAEPVPRSLAAGGKRILCDYREDTFQRTIDYYFVRMVQNWEGEFSFLSDVLPDDAAQSPFANISPYNCTPEECASIVGTADTAGGAHSGSELATNNILDSKIAGIPDEIPDTGPSEPRKKRMSRHIGNPMAAALLGLLAVAAVIALLWSR